jgi:hypothetical protein
MAAVPSVRILKTMPFKGGSRVWSNRYHFSGGTPADTTHWDTLFDAIVAAEKLILNTGHQITEAIGYAAGSDVPVAQKAYTTNGTHAIVGHLAPGEVALVARFSTAARSTKNHPIYGFSYFHGCDIDAAALAQDYADTTWRALVQTYASDWVSGFSDGTNTYPRATPAGHLCTGSYVDVRLTHRDFPYTPST